MVVLLDSGSPRAVRPTWPRAGRGDVVHRRVTVRPIRAGPMRRAEPCRSDPRHRPAPPARCAPARAWTRNDVAVTAARAGPRRRSPQAIVIPPTDHHAVGVEHVHDRDHRRREGPARRARRWPARSGRRRPRPGPRGSPPAGAARSPPRCAPARAHPRRPRAPRGRCGPCRCRCVSRSRWPAPPQPQTGPSYATDRWPSSPATPSGPDSSRPPVMTAPPTPVETVR